MKKLKVAIIGLGKIGLGYDLTDHLGTKSHTKAFLKSTLFEISLGVDPKEDARKDFEFFTKALAYQSIEDTPIDQGHLIDLVVISTPSISRVSDCQKIIEKFDRLKYVVLEKPIAVTLGEAKIIENVFKNENLTHAVFVNYMRRCNHEFIELRDRIQRGEFGELRSIEMLYPDTFINMGSHFIDLVCFLTNLKFEAISKEKFICFDNNDFSCNTILKAGRVEMKIVCSKERKSEMELHYSKKLIKITNSGTKLFIENDLIEIDLTNYQKDVVAHLEDAILNNTKLLSNFDTALETLGVCESVRVL